MLFPPSLSQAVLSRTFHAKNGELGLLLADAEDFLAACDKDAVEVLGWELWLVDHMWNETGMQIPAPGLWCGGIPTIEGQAFFGGSGGSNCCRREIANLKLPETIDDQWIPYVRINFTLRA